MNAPTDEKTLMPQMTKASFISLKDEQLLLDEQLKSWGETLSNFPLNKMLQIEILRDSPLAMLADAGEEVVHAKDKVNELLLPFLENQTTKDQLPYKNLYEGLEKCFTDLYVGFRAKAEDALMQIEPEDVIDVSALDRFREFYLSESENIPPSLKIIVRKSDGSRIVPGATIAELENASLNGALLVNNPGLFKRFSLFLHRIRLKRKYTVLTVPLRLLVQNALTEETQLGLEDFINQYRRQHEQTLIDLERRWSVARFAFVSALAEINEQIRLSEQGVSTRTDFKSVHEGLIDALDDIYENADSLSSPYRVLRRDLPQAIQKSHDDLVGSIAQLVEIELRPVSRVRRLAKNGKTAARQYKSTATHVPSLFQSSAAWLRETGLPKITSSFSAIREQFTTAPQTQEKLLALADLPDYKEIIHEAYQTYPILSEIYSPDPLDTNEFVVSRESEMEGLMEAVSRWESGYLSSIAIVGSQGSGKTTLLNSFVNQSLPDISIRRVEIKKRLRSASNVIEFLQGVFEIEETCENLDQLIELLLALPRQIVIIEGGHNIMLRAIGGRQAPQSFLYVMMATRSRLLWIFSCRELPWSQLDYLVGISRYFTHETHIGRTDERILKDVIMRRSEAVGLPLTFYDEEIPKRGIPHIGLGKVISDLEKQAQLRDNYFNDLAGITGGNIQAGLYFWLSSLSYDNANKQIVVAPCTKINARVIEGLDRLYLFTLAELLKHGELTPEEHGEIFMMSEMRSRLTLNYLVQLRLVDPLYADTRARPYAYEVSNVLINIIASTLRSMNILY